MNRVAAIDIGSNSLLLTIAEKNPDLQVLRDEIFVTGLARGLNTTRIIQDLPFEKSCFALKQFRQWLNEHQVTMLKVVATEALRQAKNGPVIQQKFEEIIETPIEIISGDREAELSFWSVQKEFPHPNAQKIVFDVGGASTEVCLGSQKGIQKKTSLKCGSIFLTEKFLLHQPTASQEAWSWVMKELKEKISWQIPHTLGIGVAGTLTTLFAVEQELLEYKRVKVHGKWMARERLQFWRDKILLLPLEERKKIPGLPENRADVFGGGLVIASALAQFFQWNKIYCMDSGVRFGLIYEMLNGSDTQIKLP